MASARGRRQQRKSGARPRGLAAVLVLVLFCGPLGPVWRAGAQPVAGGVSFADIEATLGQMDDVGAFFTAFAVRDTNGFARERWRRLGVNYPGTAAILRDLIARDLLRIDDLPEGRSSALLDRGEIVIDHDLDGRWGPGPPLRGTAPAVQRRDLLLPELMQALARRQLSQDWPWLADHLRAVGGLAKIAEDPVARPLLARFFQAKDAYLWLAMQRAGEGDPAVRQALARRQTRTFTAIRALATDMAATFGAASAERLQGDWSEYVAQVDGFAVTRGWMLLDPALRQTSVGEAARREADAVDWAAADVVASSPRSALAAAREDARRLTPPRRSRATAAEDATQYEGVNLGAVVARTPKITPPESAADLDTGEIAALAARLPLATLAMRPEGSGTVTDPAALRAFAVRLREAVEQPDPRQVLAEREQQLGAVRQEVATLKSRVEEMATALETRAQEAEHLQSALAAERARLADAERRAAEEAAAAEQRLAASERRAAEEAAVAERRLAAAEAEARAAAAAALSAQRRAAEERAATQRAEAERMAAEQAAAEAAAAAREAERREAEQRQLAEAPRIRLVPAPSQTDELGSVLSRIEQRQLYMMVTIALIFLMVLLFWLRSRRRPVVIEQPPLLLASPEQGAAVPRAAAATMPARPIIDVPEEAPAGRATTAAGRVKINGVTPSTADAKAAMKAGSARRGAGEAAAREAAAAAARLGEADAAAHPIVAALRKGNLPLFELLFSEMTELRAPQLQRIVYGGRGEDLAIVCRAVGVDKLLFGSIFLLTDHLRGGGIEEEPERTAEILRMYDRMPPETARKVLAKWQRNWSGAGSAGEQHD